MKKIILNERLYSEDCLKYGLIERNPYRTLAILAKYYYHVLGYRRKKIAESLSIYAEKNCPDYRVDRAKIDEYIDVVSRNAGKQPLYEIDGIKITKTEFDRIATLDTNALKRLAFTYLCLAKLGMARNPSKNGWVSDKISDIFDLAHISASIDKQDEMISKLYQCGMLEFAKRNDNLSCRVTFIDDASSEQLFVTDFRELGYEYLKYIGENYARCAECGILFKKTNNNMRYCRACAAPPVQQFKIITCEDCGKELLTSSMNRWSTRCSDCQAKRNKEMSRKYYEEHRETAERV